jgi:hypothetical protein
MDYDKMGKCEYEKTKLSKGKKKKKKGKKLKQIIK